MLGSLSEADDAVQETWLRLSRSDASAVQNLGGWLTTIVARVCLNMLSSRQARHEEPAGADLPGPAPDRGETADPEQQALLAGAFGWQIRDRTGRRSVHVGFSLDLGAGRGRCWAGGTR
jgi:RNA polymerase sigma-70 factor (ECF subfamily)